MSGHWVTPDPTLLFQVGEERKAIESRGDARRRYSLYEFVGILLPVMAWGLFVRFDDLGSHPLSVDEYYSVTGVQYILEKGVPVFPTGGYYLRAWPSNTLRAASARLKLELPTAPIWSIPRTCQSSKRWSALLGQAQELIAALVRTDARPPQSVLRK
jgi:hypothetical protein